MLVKNTEYVYESPDGGETVYRRKIGDATRELYWVSDKKIETLEELKQEELWLNIRKTAKTNPTLQAALDRAKLIYYVSMENHKK